MSDRNIELSYNGDKSKIPTQVILNHKDARFPFTLRNFSSDVPTFMQVFIKQEYSFSVTSSPEVILDAGANIGLASIYFATKFPNTKIISIEPEESNFKLLQINSNPYKNIIPVQAALWNKNGIIDLIDPGLGHWGFMTDKENNQEKPLGLYKHKVSSITIDKLMKTYGADAIDILKIDIEGAEKEVFNDSSAWIGKVRALIIELHERMKPGCNRSFYNGSNGFDCEWSQGENIYLSRGKYLTRVYT